MMIFPWQLSLSLGRYVAANRLRGRVRFPLVLMLEPTLRCNLACAGCGRIREERETGGRMLTAEECLAAIDEAGAPVVSVTGGQLLHLRSGTSRAALWIASALSTSAPTASGWRRRWPSSGPAPPGWVVHLDGLAETTTAWRGGGLFGCHPRHSRCQAGGPQVRTTPRSTNRAGRSWRSSSPALAAGVDGLMLPRLATRRSMPTSFSPETRPWPPLPPAGRPSPLPLQPFAGLPRLPGRPAGAVQPWRRHAHGQGLAQPVI